MNTTLANEMPCNVSSLSENNKMGEVSCVLLENQSYEVKIENSVTRVTVWLLMCLNWPLRMRSPDLDYF